MNSSQEFSDLATAKLEFEKKFLSKTGNKWEDRTKFVPKSGKYTLIKMDYSAPETDKSAVSAPVEIEPSKLHPKLQQMVSKICDVMMMEKVTLTTTQHSNLQLVWK